jgi:hypothetical protein
VELAIELAKVLATDVVVNVAELEVANEETKDDEESDRDEAEAAFISLAPSTPLLKETAPTLPLR